MRIMIVCGLLMLAFVAGCSDPDYAYPTLSAARDIASSSVDSGSQVTREAHAATIQTTANMLIAQSPDRAADIDAAKDGGLVTVSEIKADTSGIQQAGQPADFGYLPEALLGVVVTALGANQFFGRSRQEKADDKSRKQAERNKRMEAIDQLAGMAGQIGIIPPQLAAWIQQMTPNAPPPAPPAPAPAPPAPAPTPQPANV